MRVTVRHASLLIKKVAEVLRLTRLLITAFSVDRRRPRSPTLRALGFAAALCRAHRIGAIAEVSGHAVLVLTPPKRPRRCSAAVAVMINAMRHGMAGPVARSTPFRPAMSLNRVARSRWVVSNMAAVPARRGWGGKLLEGVCAAADRRGVGLALRASSAASARLYERHGFRTVSTTATRRGMVMVRDPKPTSPSSSGHVPVIFIGRLSTAWRRAARPKEQRL